MVGVDNGQKGGTDMIHKKIKIRNAAGPWLAPKKGWAFIRVGKWTGDTSRFPHCQMKFLFFFFIYVATHTSNNNRKIITLTSVVSFVRFLFFFSFYSVGMEFRRRRRSALHTQEKKRRIFSALPWVVTVLSKIALGGI